MNRGDRLQTDRRHSQKGQREGARFELFGESFFIPLSGDFIIRNAAMACSAAHYYGIPTD